MSVLPEDVDLTAVIIRNTRTKFYYHETTTNGGTTEADRCLWMYTFVTTDRKRGIRLTANELSDLLSGRKFEMGFGNRPPAVYYVDWAIRDQRLALEESKRRYEVEQERKKQLNTIINHTISDDDPDLLAYVDALQAKFGKHNTLDGYTKRLIYGVRIRNYDVLVEILAQARGQNVVSKQTFERLTGETLPLTKHGIQVFLADWCQTQPKVSTGEPVLVNEQLALF